MRRNARYHRRGEAGRRSPHCSLALLPPSRREGRRSFSAPRPLLLLLRYPRALLPPLVPGAQIPLPPSPKAPPLLPHHPCALLPPFLVPRGILRPRSSPPRPPARGTIRRPSSAARDMRHPRPPAKPRSIQSSAHPGKPRAAPPRRRVVDEVRAAVRRLVWELGP